MAQELNIHQKINIRQLAKEFPIIGKKEMSERLRKLRIGVSGEFESSMTFRGKVLVNGVMLEIDYLFYGMFPDLGIGKGMTTDDVSVAKLVGSGRKKKNWTRKLAHFRHRLGELYTQVAADEISQHVNQSYDRTLRFKL